MTLRWCLYAVFIWICRWECILWKQNQYHCTLNVFRKVLHNQQVHSHFSKYSHYTLYTYVLWIGALRRRCSFQFEFLTKIFECAWLAHRPVYPRNEAPVRPPLHSQATPFHVIVGEYVFLSKIEEKQNRNVKYVYMLDLSCVLIELSNICFYYFIQFSVSHRI